MKSTALTLVALLATLSFAQATSGTTQESATTDEKVIAIDAQNQDGSEEIQKLEEETTTTKPVK